MYFYTEEPIQEHNTNKINRYRHVPAKARSEATGMVAQSLPMAAMFMKNKLLSWTSLFLAIQSYLNDPINKQDDPESTQQPPLLKIVFALIAVCTCYIDLIFPKTNPAAKAGNLAQTVSATVSSVISSATGSN